MATFDDYTRDDWVAWVHLHPYDADCELWVPDTIGFQAFVLGRRFEDLTASVLEGLDPVYRRLAHRLTQVSGRFARAKAWWWLKRLQWRYWWNQRRG